MSEVLDYIQRVVLRCGLKREKFQDNALPKSITSVKVIVHFSDFKSDFLLSTLLLPRLVDDSQYTILLSWTGKSGLYDCVDEYWCVNDEMLLTDIARNIQSNKLAKAIDYEKMLLKYFDNVINSYDLILPYYNNGLTKAYFDKFNTIEYYLPTIPSVQLPGNSNKKRIFIHPCKAIKQWINGHETYTGIDVKLWSALIQTLVDHKYLPVIYQDQFAYDLSAEFSSNCVYVVEKNILSVLGAMRVCDCVLDVFSGIYRYAIIARGSFLVCDDRQRYFETSEYVIDDLCSSNLNYSNFFTFAPLLNTSNKHILEAIVNRVDKFVKQINNQSSPSSISSTQQLTYNSVRRRELRRLGTRLIKVPEYES